MFTQPCSFPQKDCFKSQLWYVISWLGALQRWRQGDLQPQQRHAFPLLQRMGTMGCGQALARHHRWAPSFDWLINLAHPIVGEGWGSNLFTDIAILKNCFLECLFQKFSFQTRPILREIHSGSLSFLGPLHPWNCRWRTNDCSVCKVFTTCKQDKHLKETKCTWCSWYSNWIVERVRWS